LDEDLVVASATPPVLGILANCESYGCTILQQVAPLARADR
jgi:hypothetical protein